MNRKKELCRNFQRGSCQYGDRCKFLHTTTQQQHKPSPFGFGVQNASSPFFAANQAPHHQQQKANPFGFGVQNTSQARGGSNVGSIFPAQPQPFVNKWMRTSSTTAAGSKPSKQGETQPQVVPHKCTDPESCKRQIIEDFNEERPLWRLTCYGHSRGLQCDIVGDVSYEELRTAAYEDARRGLSLQTIVERERSLLNSKLIELDNFLRTPYVVPQTSSLAGQGFPSATSQNPSSVDTQKHIIPFSSFSQPGASLNVGPTIRPSPVSNIFGHTSTFQSHNQTSSIFGMNLGTPVASPMHVSSSSASFPSHVDSPKSAVNTVSQLSADVHPVKNVQENYTGDSAIWLKEEWEIGEIPEEEPPARFCM